MKEFNSHINEVVSKEDVNANMMLDREEMIQNRNEKRGDGLSHMALRAKKANSNQSKDCVIM